MKRLRIAIVCDYPEEGWPSMDLVAEMVLTHLQTGHEAEVEAVRVCPPYRTRAGLSPIRRTARAARNLDRLLNRYVDYPRYLRRLAARESFDVYHVIDHSYAQLVHAVPPGRAIVTCHDLDTFRCLLHPDVDPRPSWFRALTRRTLTGLQSAAAIACDSEATRSVILEHRLTPPERLTTVYLGVSSDFIADRVPEADAALDRLIGRSDSPRSVDLLHVGSNIRRKRIDVLLRTFAAVRRQIPEARLIKVGGDFDPTQAALARDLDLAGSILILPFLNDRRVLAALYRRAALVLLPSEAEGFGFPMVEATSCGAQVLASDLPVLREVGGDAAVYRPMGDVESWGLAAVEMIGEYLSESDVWQGRRSAGLARSGLFRWKTHAARLVDHYKMIAGGR